MPPPNPARAAKSISDGARFVKNVKNRADATRFAQNVRSPPAGGSGETPQQRVARLREAARRERMNQVTTFDKIIHRGRIWADNAHRVTVFSIMGFSAVTIGVTVYSVTGMITQGRSNRREYLSELSKEQEKQWSEWRESEILQLIGTGLTRDEATELFDYAEETRRKSRTFFGKLRTWAIGGLTPAEETYMSRYELHQGTVKKQVFERLQKEFYEERGLEMPKKPVDDDEDDDEDYVEAAAAGTVAAIGGALPTAPLPGLKEGDGEVKKEGKGYWGTLRSWVSGGRV